MTEKAVALSGGGVLGLALVVFPHLAAAVVPSILGGILLMLLDALLVRHYPEQRRRVRRWMFLAFLVHVGVGALITFRPTLAWYLGPDAFAYDAIARDLAAYWKGEILQPPVLPAGKEGFYYMLAGEYWLLGPYTIAGLVTNAVLATALIPLLTATTTRVFGPAAARFTPPLLVLLPAFVVWPSQLLREAAVFFLLAVAVFAAVSLAQRTAPAPMVVLVVALSTLFTVRGYVAAVVSFGILAGLGIARGRLATAVGASVSVGSMLLAVVILLGFGYSGYKVVAESDLEEVNQTRRNTSTAVNSAFDAETDVSTPGRAITYLPWGLTQFVFGPLPWQARGVRQLPALIDAVTWWALLPSLWRGIRAGARMDGRGLSLLFIPAVCLACVLALVIGNFGHVVRARSQVLVLLVPVLAFGLSLRRLGRGPQPAPTPLTRHS